MSAPVLTPAPAATPEAPAGSSRRTRSARRGSGAPREKLMSRTAAMTVMVISTFYFLLPVWWLFTSATKSREDFGSTNGLLFGDFDLITNIGNLFAYNDGV